MSEEPLLRVESLPELRQPVFVAAFAGWNDAAEAATHAASVLVQQWSAQRFADIDPETFYNFTETRPTIRLGASGQRELSWPENSFFAHRANDADRDVVVLIGVEPQLRWRTYCSLIIDVADKLDASALVTVGALLADVPHTMATRLTGFATSGTLLTALRKSGLRASTYEGPTGVVGTLHDAWIRSGRDAVSIWGNVPHYISASPNYAVSLSLLHALANVLDLKVSLGGVERQAVAFRSSVEEALQHNPEALEYVRQLEEQHQTPPGTEETPELIDELEQYLRSRRPQDEE